MDVFDEIRAASAAVMERARSVRIDADRIEAVARALVLAPPAAPVLDPRHHHFGSRKSTLAFVLTLNAVNFGSGWFPFLRKRPHLSGYFTVAASLKERFDNRGPWSSVELAELEAPDCAAVFGQDLGVPELAELMELFARALRDLGTFLTARFAGCYEGPLEKAGASAAQLVGLLSAMPCFDDVQSYGGLRVPFFKRAQLTAADLSLAFRGQGWGRFHDLDRLTLFADNLVPHVLRLDGVLVYAPDLLQRIESEETIRAGSPEEVEIRAGAVHAVELLVDAVRRQGGRATARELDYVLWNRGQLREIKAHPRHRSPSVFY